MGVAVYVGDKKLEQGQKQNVKEIPGNWLCKMRSEEPAGKRSQVLKRMLLQQCTFLYVVVSFD